MSLQTQRTRQSGGGVLQWTLAAVRLALLVLLVGTVGLPMPHAHLSATTPTVGATVQAPPVVASAPQPSPPDCMDSLLQQTTAGVNTGVRQYIASQDANKVFMSIAADVRPHRNPELAAQGALEGKLRCRDGAVFYRPISKSGPPTIDLKGVPGVRDFLKIKF